MGRKDMIITCPRCGTKFRLSEDKIKPEGTRFRCSRCGHEFYQSEAETVQSSKKKQESIIDQKALEEMESEVFYELKRRKNPILSLFLFFLFLLFCALIIFLYIYPQYINMIPLLSKGQPEIQLAQNVLSSKQAVRVINL